MIFFTREHSITTEVVMAGVTGFIIQPLPANGSVLGSGSVQVSAAGNVTIPAGVGSNYKTTLTLSLYNYDTCQSTANFASVTNTYPGAPIQKTYTTSTAEANQANDGAYMVTGVL